MVQRAGGWRTPIMMQRYAHLDPRTIKAAVALLDADGHHEASEHQRKVKGSCKCLICTVAPLRSTHIELSVSRRGQTWPASSKGCGASAWVEVSGT